MILWHNSITLKHTIWHFRWNVQIKTINYYTHIITLPTTLKQALLLLDPVLWFNSIQNCKYLARNTYTTFGCYTLDTVMKTFYKSSETQNCFLHIFCLVWDCLCWVGISCLIVVLSCNDCPSPLERITMGD